MTRTIDALIELAGPVGPWGTDEQRDRLREELRTGEPLGAAERILAAVDRRPALPANVERRWFDFAAAELLADLAQQPPVRQRLERALGEPPLRRIALESLALLADPAAAPALAALAGSELAAPSLDEDEMIHLASALGSAGGPQARSAVEALRAGRSWPQAVARELDIALDAMREPG